METGMVVQERHTAPVGDRVGFFARNDGYGEAARRNEGRGPRKVPAAFGLCPKVPRPVAEGRQLFGEGALPAPAAAGGHARNLQMLTG